jgi:outer membrane protein OmpA-like peptidoglycan-associated protein
MLERTAHTAPAAHDGVIRFVTDAWPLLALGVIGALLIRACVPVHSSPAVAAAAPSFDAPGAPKVVNAQALAALSALTPASGIAQVMDALGLLSIDFGVGSSTLPESADPALAQAATVIAARPPAERFQISAYADGTGSPLADLELSRRRAQAVVDGLVNQGVPTQRLQARGVGGEDAVPSEPGQQSSARAQRIQFTLLP